jgi:peptidoglycan-associated lipoprotein
MNRKAFFFLILTLLLFTFGCPKKDEDIPVPKSAPPVEVAKETNEIKETAKPDVHVDETPESLDEFISKIQMDDVYFDFDRAELRTDAKDMLNKHGQILLANKQIMVLIEGHCDSRGTTEYNRGLGERRASRILEYFTSLGIHPSRLKTVSYGEEQPKVQGENEEAWAQNRRAHFQLAK